MTRLSRFLFVLWDGGGVVPPTLGIARRLVARGHEVVVLGDPTVADEARAAGCAFQPWVEAPHRTSRAREADILKDYAATNRMKYFEQEVGGYFFAPAERWMADILRVLDAERFDVVVSDQFLVWGQVAAEARGLPAAVLSTMPYNVPTAGVRPAGAAMMPVPGWLAPLRDQALRALTEWLYGKALPHLARVRAAHGLPPVARFTDQWRRADALLVLTAAAFDHPGAAAPAGVHWVGAPPDDPTWCTPWTSPWPVDDARPLVLVSLSSTFQDQVPLLNRLVQALARLPVRGLVTLGPVVRPEEVPGAANVVVTPSAPHATVLPQAAVLVTHCGHGTLMKGLAAGVPLVCLPMGRDQDDNAARAVAHGVGLKRAPKASVDELAAAIQEVLHSPRYREAAVRMAEAIARREGEQDPVQILERLGTREAAAAR